MRAVLEQFGALVMAPELRLVFLSQKNNMLLLFPELQLTLLLVTHNLYLLSVYH